MSYDNIYKGYNLRDIVYRLRCRTANAALPNQQDKASSPPTNSVLRHYIRATNLRDIYYRFKVQDSGRRPPSNQQDKPSSPPKTVSYGNI